MRVIYGPMFTLGVALASSPAAAKPLDITFLSSSLSHSPVSQDAILVAHTDTESLLSLPIGQNFNNTSKAYANTLAAPSNEHCTRDQSALCASLQAETISGAELHTSRPVSVFSDNTTSTLTSEVPTHWDLATLDKTPVANLEPANFTSLPDEDGSDRYRLPSEDCGITCPSANTITPAKWTDHVPTEYASHPSFWSRVKSVKTESLLFLGYFGIMSGNKLFKETKPFHFKDEGWFGKDTDNIGVDKVTHAFNTYLLAEFLHNRMHHNTGASAGDAVTAGILASGLMMFNEMSDGIETDSGWSIEDVISNFVGAGFSVLRNTVPGMKEKVSFKVEIVPNSQIYSHVGKKHYEQQRFMLSLKGSGFKELENTPLKYLDLQVGYYASDFLLSDRAAGVEPKRHLFVGVGLNLGEIFFGNSRSRVGKAAYSVLDYFQVPYTSMRYDTTGRFGT